MIFLDFTRILSTPINEISFLRIFKAFLTRMKFPFYFLQYNSFLKGFKENRKKLDLLKNSASRNRLFILATGPGLNKVNLNLLVNEDVMTMNRGYMLQKSLNIKYLVCIDIKTQLLQFFDSYNGLTKFTTFYEFKLFNRFVKAKNRIFIISKPSPRFIKNKSQVFGNGRSVTYTCIQLAYYLGYKEVIILGKDHSYVAKGIPGSKNEIAEKSNHFIKNYYSKGDKFDTPDYHGEEFAYRLAKDKFENTGRSIIDCSVNGKLLVFRKAELSSVLNAE